MHFGSGKMSIPSKMLTSLLCWDHYRNHGEIYTFRLCMVFKHFTLRTVIIAQIECGLLEILQNVLHSWGEFNISVFTPIFLFPLQSGSLMGFSRGLLTLEILTITVLWTKVNQIIWTMMQISGHKDNIKIISRQ